MLKPLGHRVLISPDATPEQSESGLVLPQDRDHVPVSGTVVALGPGGSQMRFSARQRAIHDCAQIIESAIHQWGAIACLTLVRDEIAGLLGSSEPAREIAVGDRVAFPANLGLDVTHDGQDYVMCHEDDVAVLVEEAEAVA
jgi:co-chaperonin GroES (HSP10)